MTHACAILIVALVAIGIVGMYCAYIVGRTNGWRQNDESRVPDADHRRGIRGFDRPEPFTAETEAVIHTADYRDRSEGFDL